MLTEGQNTGEKRREDSSALGAGPGGGGGYRLLEGRGVFFSDVFRVWRSVLT